MKVIALIHKVANRAEDRICVLLQLLLINLSKDYLLTFYTWDLSIACMFFFILHHAPKYQFSIRIGV